MRKDINWPRRWQSFGRSITKTLLRKKEFSATASEFLTVYPALRAYLHSLNLHESGDEHVLRVLQSFFAMTDLLELVHSSMRKAIMWQESACIFGRFKKTQNITHCEADYIFVKHDDVQGSS